MNYYDLERTSEEIDEVLNRAADAMDNGSQVPGMSYEQGVHDAIQWAIGNYDDNPMPEEE